MYHIKQDKRVLASVELICGGMKDCLAKKKFEDITISDLQRASGVSRSTFYRSFDRMEDVLALMCDRVFEEALSTAGDNVSETVFSTWFRHADMVETIVGIKRADVLYDSLFRCVGILRTEEGGSSAMADYFISIIVSTMMGIMITWVERGKREGEKELKKMILDCFGAMHLIGISLE